MKQNHWTAKYIYVPDLRGERGGSVVECRTPEREVRGSRPTAAVLCPWARHFTPRKYWLITQEAMAPSRYDWKIVDWDVKPQHNQPTNLTYVYFMRSIFASYWYVTPSNDIHTSHSLTGRMLTHIYFMRSIFVSYWSIIPSMIFIHQNSLQDINQQSLDHEI